MSWKDNYKKIRERSFKSDWHLPDDLNEITDWLCDMYRDFYDYKLVRVYATIGIASGMASLIMIFVYLIAVLKP